ESIELLELAFLCENRLGIRVKFEDMISPDKFPLDDQGRVTSETLAKIKTAFPFLNTDDVPTDSETSNLRSLLTVRAVIEFVRLAVEKNEAAAKAD
ncbi:MAG: hypothetical protein N2C14_08780, partial [Planctomycetales bacterium]